MQNHIFNIEFNKESGLISTLSLCSDKDNMNWIAENGFWGKMHHITHIFQNGKIICAPIELKNFEESETFSKSVFSNGSFETTLTTSFKGEYLVQ